MSSTYPFTNLPLTPGVFATLASELYGPGATVERSAMIELVATAHAERGGTPARGSVASVAKKALGNMLDAGVVQRAGVHGFWRFMLSASVPGEHRLIEVGDGRQAVYVYYFPAYRELATRRGESLWPMKIGMTKSADFAFRITDQCGTSMPEKPVVGLVYRTNEASNGERLLHSTLSTKNRHIDEAPGKEWFLTNLDEVKGILDFALS